MEYLAPVSCTSSPGWPSPPGSTGYRPSKHTGSQGGQQLDISCEGVHGKRDEKDNGESLSCLDQSSFILPTFLSASLSLPLTSSRLLAAAEALGTDS